MKTTIPTVTVAVSAYNEEANIEHFLRSVLMQKQEGYILQKILVISDGSTDETVKKTRLLQQKNPIIDLIVHPKRVGKSTHLNWIYKNLSTDLLVQSDADVRFAHPAVIHDLIAPLLTDSRVGMCGGNPMPASGTTFWERMVQTAFEPYQTFRSSVRRGNNAFSAIGQLLAYRKTFVKGITIPTDMVTNDIFTYFCCLTAGWKYAYVSSAIVLFQAPKKLADVIKQNTRFHTGYNRMYDHFSSDLVNKEMSIPKPFYIRTLLKQCIKHPIYAMAYYMTNIYCKLRARSKEKYLTATWPIATTTKRFSVRLKKPYL